jgi:hypothetical protein
LRWEILIALRDESQTTRARSMDLACDGTIESNQPAQTAPYLEKEQTARFFASGDFSTTLRYIDMHPQTPATNNKIYVRDV